MPEPTPFRDFGPYPSAREALEQFAATTYGMPGSNAAAAAVILGEVVALAGLAQDITDYERHALNRAAVDLPPAVVQVIAGLIIRARMRPAPGARPDLEGMFGTVDFDGLLTLLAGHEEIVYRAANPLPLVDVDQTPTTGAT